MTIIPDDSLVVQFDSSIRRVKINSVIYFSIIDIFRYYSEAANAARSWGIVETFLIKQGAISEGWPDGGDTQNVLLRMHKFEGKGQRPTPVGTFSAVMRIAQVTTFKNWEFLRQWMAELADQQVQIAAKNRLRNVVTQSHLNRGKSLNHAKTLSKNLWTFEELAKHIIRLCEITMITKVIDQEYMTLLGETQKRLKEMLHTRSTHAIREGLPELQMQYLELGETGLNAILQNIDSIKPDDLLALVVKVFMPLAEHLRMICDTMEIHRVTSKPLRMMVERTE